MAQEPSPAYLLSALLLGVTLQMYPSSLAAEIRNCNGKWTDQPCEAAGSSESDDAAWLKRGAVSKYTGSRPAAAAATPSEPLAPRLELIRKLKRENKDSQKKGGAWLSSSEIDAFSDECEDLSKPYAQCKVRYDELLSKVMPKTPQDDILGNLNAE